jgi:hypothetical protein
MHGPQLPEQQNLCILRHSAKKISILFKTHFAILRSHELAQCFDAFYRSELLRYISHLKLFVLDLSSGLWLIARRRDFERSDRRYLCCASTDLRAEIIMRYVFWLFRWFTGGNWGETVQVPFNLPFVVADRHSHLPPSTNPSLSASNSMRCSIVSRMQPRAQEKEMGKRN